ncbi:hypothetical protein BD779DRAFT_1471594 [Infundibulicybe gibba]|nr:hypothetical protein BD779DRAFT_1471594 [Infundibulicybe gibba]
MRESNFAFPAQNKACVCITSQLYDRRALDTTSALPLFNSLTHLTYLTSTSPRIREIMTMDGGLERLVRILHDFCICPPPPDNPAILYGLSPPNARPPKLVPTLNPQSFDKHAAYRFSLAFQCVVNIGVRGSEPIRSRVVQAGTLDVVGCVLEAWLANKGFAVGPSSSATGMPRETREQRQARRNAQAEQRQKAEASALSRALQRQIQIEQQQQVRSQREQVRQQIRLERDEPMDVSPSGSRADQAALVQGTSAPGSDTDVDTSTENSATVTPLGSSTPTGSVIVPGRDRSGTIIARPVWDAPAPNTNQASTTTRQPSHQVQDSDNDRASPTPSGSTDVSRPDTETEDDGDGDVVMDRVERRRHNNADSDVSASASASPSPERHPHPHLSLGRRTVGIVSDTPANGVQVGNMNLAPDAHIIINGVGGVGEGVGVGVEDGLVSLEPNDDFAMGAPPGAPGAIDEGATPRGLELNVMEVGRRRNISDAPDVTPRAGVVNLPATGITNAAAARAQPGPHHQTAGVGHHRNVTARGASPADTPGPANAPANPGATTTTPATASLNHTGARTSASGSTHHHRDPDAGPYRDEDVLLSLQLLAYLSKYPHVRQAFYKPRVTFHPASANLPGARFGVGAGGSLDREREKVASSSTVPVTKDTHGFFRAFTSVASGRGKEKEKANPRSSIASPITANAATIPPANARQTNVFSLVERFTFKPSSTEADMPNPPPKLPPDIQYWAGVIMRNACRKDDSRGGIRQCANMLCGRWEAYPREFAKCRRCRKAKYCGKECQSTAWSEGHRFWCSARDGEEDGAGEHHAQTSQTTDADASVTEETTNPVIPTNTTVGTSRSRPARDRAHHLPLDGPGDTATIRGPRSGITPFIPPSITQQPVAPTNARAEGSMSRDRTIQGPAAPGVSPGRVRPPGYQANARGAAQGTTRGDGNWLVFDLYAGNQADGGRRRAETITLPLSSPGGSRISEVPIGSHPQHLHQPPPAHHLPREYDQTMHPNASPEAGPSRRVRPAENNTYRATAENAGPSFYPAVMPTTSRPEAGPSTGRFRTADSSSVCRSPAEDHDMVLG